MHEMSLREAKSIIHSLSLPDKMPGYAWSLSAYECNVGTVLAEIKGSSCATCYAKKGNYPRPVVKNALAKRMESLRDPRWEDAMVRVLSSKAVSQHGVFRWFDSGDIQSDEMFVRICNVVRRTPFLKHWLPTREYAILKRFVRHGGVIPKNLIVRVSAPMVDGPAPKWWKWTSGIHRYENPKGRSCPAPQQDGKCGSCRTCWDKRTRHITYHYH